MQCHEWLWIAGGELVGCTCLIRYARLYVLPIIMHSTTLSLSRPASRLVTTTLPAHDHIQLQPCCSWYIGDHSIFDVQFVRMWHTVVSIALAVYKTVVLSPCRLYSKDSALICLNTHDCNWGQEGGLSLLLLPIIKVGPYKAAYVKGQVIANKNHPHEHPQFHVLSESLSCYTLASMSFWAYSIAIT